MPLFESGYRAAAKTELERKVRELENRNAVAQKKPDIGETAAVASHNIEFAHRIKLITDKEAEQYRKRINQAREAEELARTQTGDRVDGFMNPHEAGERQYDLEEEKARISREQAERKQQKPREEQEQTGQTPKRTGGEEPERTPRH